MIFFDTSIYVAAATRTHGRHAACSDVLEKLYAEGQRMSCGVYGLSELYSVLTRMPPPDRVEATVALTIVERVMARTEVISLTLGEHVDVIREAAKQRLVGGAIHDLTLIACARKAGATTVYTLNQRHFKLAAPDMASIIHYP